MLPFSRTLTSVTGNARLAAGDLATEVRRLRDRPGEGVVSIAGASLAAAATPLDLRPAESRAVNSRVVYLRHQRIR
jgi:hypothetical protein